jgi:adenine-specific DNA-methyltransferase
MFSKLSHDLTKSFDKEEIKTYGIYFTPKNIIDKCLSEVRNVSENSGLHITEILEPSCGSCEFVAPSLEIFPQAHLDCVEYNRTIYEEIIHLQEPRVTIYCADFLRWTAPPATNTNHEKKYDLIIGNPPYFVMKKPDVSRKYHPYFEGRPNIYVIFILKSLEMLSDGGILSFVVPQNFLNCLYYSKTRKLINEQFQIRSIILCEEGGFIDTQQPTIIITIQNTAILSKEEKIRLNEPFVVRNGSGVVFNTPDRVAILNELYLDAVTLNDMGVNVSVGTVVWNQCKDILSNDANDTLLVYSSNIVNGEFVTQTYRNTEKKNYIKKEGLAGPVMVINRGYGKGTYSMDYCILNLERPYLIENHLICLTVEGEEDFVLSIYETIERTLKNPKTLRFIELYFGNNAINCNELKNCLPIYL